MNRPGKSIWAVLKEDQLLKIANDCGLESMLETTSNLHRFWIKVRQNIVRLLQKH